MPEVLDIGDGSQDALLVRVRAGGFEGWGECEASPLTSIASYVCPMSHSACKPIRYSLEGRSIHSPADIQQISESVHAHSLDLLQADHTLSGINIALWDLLGKKTGTPVYALLGSEKIYPKLPYASQLFGDTPEQTLEKARAAKANGFRAVKFGWGPFGRQGLRSDADHLAAAREGIGEDATLMVDAGTVFIENVEQARLRLPLLASVNTHWFEEPFSNGALEAYKGLADSTPRTALAGGEGCNNFVQAQAMMSHAGVQFIQIDAGRIGGISVAKRVVDLATRKNISYVNHTFTSHLALSASLQAFAGTEQNEISEYPVELKQLAKDITVETIDPGPDGFIHVPESPGLGMTINHEALRKYVVQVDIRIQGKQIYYQPDF